MGTIIIIIIIITIVTSSMYKTNFTLHPLIIRTYIQSASPQVKLRVIFLNWNLLHVCQTKP